MRRLAIVLAFALLACLCAKSNAVIPTAEQLNKSSRSGGDLAADIRAGKLDVRTQEALNNLIVTAAGELKSEGYPDQANQILNEWHNHYSALFLSRNIADHPDAIAWIGKVHSTIENLIGIDLCRATHFHDLMILNKALPVVWSPCSVNILEYEKCFAGKVDTEPEFGAVSVIDYWVTYGLVTGATMGTGYFWIAGFCADISEYAFCHLLAADLAVYVWDESCSK